MKPTQNLTVWLRGPNGLYELPYEAVFGGPAKKESRGYWLKQGAEDVLVPDVERFGERSKITEEQNWEDVPPGSALEGLLLPTPPGKAYRLLKVVTQPATLEQAQRLGNDRAPVVIVDDAPITLEELTESMYFDTTFQIGYGEELYRRKIAAEVMFRGPRLWTFDEKDGRNFSGTFRGQVETSDNLSGETTGSFEFALPRGLTGKPKNALDGVEMKIEIETLPQAAVAQ